MAWKQRSLTLLDEGRVPGVYEKHEPADGPVRNDVLPIELLLDEPFDQLMCQQLLAHRLEQAGARRGLRMRAACARSGENTGYQDSLVRAEHRADG